MGIHVTPIPSTIELAAPAFTLGTANTAGDAVTAVSSDSTLLTYDATVPVTIAASATAATGSAATAARRDHVHGSAAAYTTFSAPSFTLGTANSVGTGDSVRAGATLLTFDTTLPDAITFGQSGAVGSATVTSRRDHAHAMPAETAGMELLKPVGTVVADDSASLTITGLSSTYDTYMIAISDIRVAADGAEPWLRVGDSSGIDSGSSDYAYVSQKLDSTSGSYSSSVSGGDSKIQLGLSGIGNATGEGFGGVYWLHRPGDGATRPILSGHGVMHDVSGNLRGGLVLGERQDVITLDRVQFILHSGNITSGRMTIWGLAHA